MGIPLYFKKISDEYPEIIINNIDGLNNLFLDLNCAIHPCCYNILNNYNNSTISIDNLERKMVNETINYIMLLIKKINPHFIYIAIDGVAPVAKMSQQRLRRYKSIYDKNIEEKIKKELNIEITGTKWDKNAISPGTLFMNRLTNKINNFVKDYVDNNKNVKVIFSNANIPGEGEHKILQYIKNNVVNGNLVIYGLDADLMMLSMASKCSNIYLLREAIEFGKKVDNKLLYLDIDLLKSKLITSLKIDLNSKDNGFFLTDEQSLNMIDDYIFLCFLLGNDFLPHNLSLDLRHKGHDILIDTYLENYIIFKEFITNSKTRKINNNVLYALLKILESKETSTLIKIQTKRNKFRMFNNNYESELERRLDLINHSPIVDNYDERKVDFNDKYWYNTYYKHCLNIEDDFDVQELCLNYCEGLKWNFLYYFDECPSWEWKYNFNHPPTLKDITKYLLNNNINNIKFNKGKPCNPIVQLLSILPKESRILIPYNYHKLMLQKDSPIYSYYPKTYQVDTFFKRYFWQCPPVLPVINIKKVNNAFKTISMNKDTKEMLSNNKIIDLSN